MTARFTAGASVGSFFSTDASFVVLDRLSAPQHIRVLERPPTPVASHQPLFSSMYQYLARVKFLILESCHFNSVY